MNKKIEIIPAILPRNFAELEDKIGLIEGLVKTIQIDICDGQFVPNATWPYRKHDDSFDKLLREEVGLPGWQKINFEIDLMVNRPEEMTNDWIIAGASKIVIHAEASGNIGEAIKSLDGCVEVGLAINIETPIDVIGLYIKEIQYIQCMGIDHIGFQGQEFDIKVLEKIARLKKEYPDMPISVDGGVSLETAPRLIGAGAERLIVGSAIFGNENPIDMIRKFKDLNLD
jgi:ribulose-phosphate 3-epimerase